MKEFADQHIKSKTQEFKITAKKIREWYAAWQGNTCNIVAIEKDSPKQVVSQASYLKSRKYVPACFRKRNYGAGRHFKATFVRQQLYEWWAGIRYAIDWTKLIESRRSRGKKHLARFPASVLYLKIKQLLEEYAHASLLNGKPVETFVPDCWWLKRWLEEYGLSLKKANRKYQVPRAVVKERLEIFNVNLFRLRLFCLRHLGYEPAMFNFDQSPFHNNESGAQDKPLSLIHI